MRPEPLSEFAGCAARIRRTVALILVALVTPSGAGQAADSPPKFSASTTYDAPSFVQELGRLKAGLETARTSPNALGSYRNSLPKSWAVDSGGRHYDVSTAEVVSRLAKAETQPEVRTREIDQAQAYLDALAAEAASASGPSSPGITVKRAKLQAILARPEYASRPRASAWERIRSRILRAIDKALEFLFGRFHGQAYFGNALLWLALCAAAVLIAYWIFRRWFRAARVQEITLQAEAAPARSWQEWIFAAREAAGRGDYRVAIHCAYWAGVTQLQHIGALAPDRSKTPREYLRALTVSNVVVPETLAPRRQALSALTSRLEKCWYGYQAATEADFRECLTQLESLGCPLR
jgi:Domain of unknown function (DUF4129)